MLADIHGNRPALLAVAAEIENWAPDVVIVAGDIVNRIRHCTRTEGSGQTGHSAGVSETGAMVYVVRPDHLAGKLVH